MKQNIKPLLATKADYDKIQYPVWASPKLDGIRCLMVEGIAMSRSMKPIPNHFVQEQLKGLHGLDGELMLNGDYNQIQSGIMSRDGEPDFTYHVFDSFADKNNPYGLRLRHIYLNELDWNERVSILKQTTIHNEEELDIFVAKCIAEGYEGVMIRHPEGKYKHGRSTVKEGILLKIKQFHDDEAILVEVTEKMRNDNELERDELGYAKRSSCKENLVPAGTAGSLILNWNGLEFRVGFGPGINDSDKQDIWNQREQLKGSLSKFRYQELSKDGVPRFGKFLGFRHEDDLS